jgi:hypothetical protein
VSGYLAALLLTLAVEPPLYALGLRLGARVRPRRGYAEGLLANATSHPLTWLVLFPLAPAGRPLLAAAAVEAFVVAWEAGLLRWRLGRDLPLLVGLSFVVNAVSLGLGAVLLR